jgi:hypothetical protein
MKKLTLVTLMTAAGLLSPKAHAGYDLFNDWLRVDGFGTVGAYQSDNENVRYKADTRARAGSEGDIRMDGDTLLGLQGTINPTGPVKGVIQMVSHKKIDGTTYDSSWRPLTEWAYVGWDVTPEVNVKVGRVVAPLFMISDSRSLGYSQTAVRPPQVVYQANPITNLDGITSTWDHTFGETAYTLTGLVGKSSVATSSGAFTVNRMFGGSLKAVKGDWTGRVGYTQFDADVTLTPKFRATYDAVVDGYLGCTNCTAVMAAAAPLNHVKVKMLTAGMAYEHDDYTVQAEYVTRWGTTLAAPDIRGWYVQGAKRINDWTPYLRYGETNVVDYPGFQNAAGSFKALNQSVVFGNSTRNELAFGARWDFAPKLALKFEYAMIQMAYPTSATAGIVGPALDTTSTNTALLNNFNADQGRLRVLTVNLDFVF